MLKGRSRPVVERSSDFSRHLRILRGSGNKCRLPCPGRSAAAALIPIYDGEPLTFCSALLGTMPHYGGGSRSSKVQRMDVVAPDCEEEQLAEHQTWPWERLRESVGSTHEVLATLLDPQPGERWLDVGTGAGGLAFALARRGAAVVGVDIAEDGLERARAEAGGAEVDAAFRYGDAHELPFEREEFDGVASAFGVIFAQDQERAAGELARVCRRGGKLGLTLMPPDTRMAALLATLRRFGGGPATHPATWAERVTALLGDSFELEVERRESPGPALRASSWEEQVASFAPLRMLAETLDPETVEALRKELEAVDEEFATKNAAYLIVLGRRK